MKSDKSDLPGIAQNTDLKLVVFTELHLCNGEGDFNVSSLH